MSVCGFGIGSSLILKMAIDNIVRKNNLIADVNPMDVMSVTDGMADVIFTSNEIAGQMRDRVSCPIIVIQNFMDEQEIENNALTVLKQLSEAV